MTHPTIRPLDRAGTSATKWQKYAGRDVLPFWVADMEFATAPSVIAAVERRLSHPILGYTETPASLIDATLGWLERRYAWRVPAEWLTFVAAVVPGLNMACRAIGAAGDSVLVPAPVYHHILEAPEHCGQQAIRVPLDGTTHARFLMDIERLRAALEPHTRHLLLCNPQNPTGRVYTRAELGELATFCLRHDLHVTSDEIHCPLMLEPGAVHVPIASLDADIAARTITLMAPSKAYNIPGLGCAFAIVADVELRARFRKARVGLVPTIGPLDYAATEAALRDDSGWLDALLRTLRANRDLFSGRVASLPRIATTHVEGTYLAWLDLRAFAPTDAMAFLERHGLGLSDGAQFGAPGFARFNFACAPDLLEAGLERLARAVS